MTITLFEVSNGTGWWDPANRLLADRQNRHGAQQPVPQARSRLPATEAEDLQTRMGQEGSSRLRAPSRRSREASTVLRLHLSSVDIKTHSPPVPAAPHRLKTAPPPPTKRVTAACGEVPTAVTAWLCLGRRREG
jgi:hypothetical protein